MVLVGSLYTYPFLEIAVPQSNSSGEKNYIKVCLSDVSGCKDLDWDILELLLVWVDKENLMEFLLNFLYYLYNYYMVCTLSSHSSHVT